MLLAAGLTSARTLRKRDVMELLEISDATYKTYVSVGLLRPIAAPAGTRHTFSLPAIIKKFQLA
jgi:hypothetical protein